MFQSRRSKLDNATQRSESPLGGSVMLWGAIQVEIPGTLNTERYVAFLETNLLPHLEELIFEQVHTDGMSLGSVHHYMACVIPRFRSDLFGCCNEGLGSY